jgi:cytosine/adenosine deaminase-related metal-dependent hydrolase
LSFLKFQADNIFTGTEMLGSESVLIADKKGIVQDIIDEKDAGEDIRKFSGIISPGFINCHCHLELSHLKGVIPEHTGMVDFILNIMQHRSSSSEELIQDAIEKAEDEMIANGIVAVGDICNTTNTINQKKKGKLYYHNFIEISGFVPATAQQRFDAGLDVYNEFMNYFPNNSSLVPHAPYSVSPNLFELISDFSSNKISTIHNQESKEENQFFEYGSGDFERLYRNLGIDISFYKPSGKSSLSTVLNYLTKTYKTILVHNTFTSTNDVNELNVAAAKTQFYFCLCVLANKYINDLVPNDIVDKSNFDKIVLGTDSLASNHQLNLLEEMKDLKKQYTSLSEIDLLKFATNNGAIALGIDSKYGSFVFGKQPGVLLLKDGLNSTKVRRLI